MKFEFIDNSIALDRDARRQIRSHVAKGRNVGRKLNRPSRKNLRPSGKTTRTRSPEAAPAVSQPQTPAATTSNLAPRSLAWFPVHWQQNAASVGVDLILNAVYFFSGLRHPHELDPALDYSTEPRTEWVRPIFLDEAYFHGAMATFMAAFPNVPARLANGTSQDNLAARVRHHSLALRLVNARLSGQEAMTNETLVAVMALGLYERYQGEYQRSMVHLWGAQRMLDMRGGMRNFARTRPELACKMFRADLESSLHLNTPTRFTLEDVQSLRRPYNNPITSTFSASLPNTPHPLTTQSHPSNQSLHLYLSPPLTTLVHDAIHTARLLQSACTPPPPGQHQTQTQKLPSSAVHDTFIQLGFRLQAISPLISRPTPTPKVTDIDTDINTHTNMLPAAVTNLNSEDESSVAEKAVCVGLAAFVASFIWGGGCGSLKIARLRWVEDAVGDVVSSCLNNNFKAQGFVYVGGDDGFVNMNACGEGEMEVVLWMLFIGVAAGVLPGGGENGGWVGEMTRQVVQVLGLRDWEGVVRVLGRFPWIEALHGGRGRAHWERSMGLSSSL